jgi:ferredoxin
VIRVLREYCLACGLCADQCPQDAIRLAFGKAWIDQQRCTSCYTCIEICPQGAIREEARLSLQEVRDFVETLHKKADSIVTRIDEITQKDSQL